MEKKKVGGVLKAALVEHTDQMAEIRLYDGATEIERGAGGSRSSRRCGGWC